MPQNIIGSISCNPILCIPGALDLSQLFKIVWNCRNSFLTVHLDIKLSTNEKIGVMGCKKIHDRPMKSRADHVNDIVSYRRNNIHNSKYLHG